MSTVKITASGKEFEESEGITCGEALAKAYPGRKNILAALLNDQPADLSKKITADASLKPVFDNSNLGLEIYRHSASHLMAQAVLEMYPGTLLAIGPAIENGFYYDFDMKNPITEDDIEKIEAKMAEIAARNLPITREELTKEAALEMFGKAGDKYKVEIISELDVPTVSLYRQGDFVDLCRGPHLESTGVLKNFKIISLAGAYWRGSELNQMLQRVYGTAFPEKKALDNHLRVLEEAKKRDHRKLGRELELFDIYEESGPGLILYHPAGATLRDTIIDFLKEEHKQRGYLTVATPHIYRAELWKISGHYDFYRENMYFFDIEGSEYGVKPMNCPGHVLIYRSHLRSYKDLPIKYFELGTVYRHERSGVMHGLLRVRGFTQDDAHIFCMPSQLIDVIKEVVAFALYMMKTFGFEYKIRFSTRPEKSIGGDQNWEMASGAIEKALRDLNMEYDIEPGGGAFYGPKIDISMKDALGRMWQGSTVQVDFNFPQKFNLNFINDKGEKETPVMVHRAVLGSLERFMGILIENYAGAFPVWLAPVQTAVLPITTDQNEYAAAVKDKLSALGIRVLADMKNEKIGYKIRQQQMKKVPYMLVIGKKEQDSGTIALRHRTEGDKGSMLLEEFIAMISKKISDRENN